MTPTHPAFRSLQVWNMEDEAAATVAILRSKVFASSRLPEILELVGSAVEVAQASDDDRLGELLRTGSKDGGLVSGAVTPEDLHQARQDVSQWKEAGYELRLCFAPNYPRNLRTIFNRPAILFSAGEWDESVDSIGVAVVGTRKATPAGLNRARRLARELCDAGVTILSGLAAGIDTAAHTAALEAGGRTTAVMGTGLDRVYPAENRDLARRIQGAGALFSQFFPNQRGAQWTFPLRNVTMSGLSVATVVIEASDTSGARMQARYALQHGRPVFLLRSLVEQHQWAREYVEEGRYGVRARLLETTDDLLGEFPSEVGVELTGAP